MKKLLVICLALAISVAACLPVLAGAFVESPSRNQAPELVDGKNSAEDCEAQLIITAYADRNNLADDIKVKIEEAYEMIVNAEDISVLNEDIATFATNVGVKTGDLAVSDMFDISATHCGSHEGHGHFDITLKSETLENFVCLLHYYNGEWEIVENAHLTNGGTHLEFDVAEFSPFAIVVNTSAEIVEPPVIQEKPIYFLEKAVVASVIIAVCIGLTVLVTKKRNVL